MLVVVRGLASSFMQLLLFLCGSTAANERRNAIVRPPVVTEQEVIYSNAGALREPATAVHSRVNVVVQLRQRAYLLAHDDAVREVHNELVNQRRIMTEDEFWAQRKVHYRRTVFSAC